MWKHTCEDLNSEFVGYNNRIKQREGWAGGVKPRPATRKMSPFVCTPLWRLDLKGWGGLERDGGEHLVERWKEGSAESILNNGTPQQWGCHSLCGLLSTSLLISVSGHFLKLEEGVNRAMSGWFLYQGYGQLITRAFNVRSVMGCEGISWAREAAMLV